METLDFRKLTKECEGLGAREAAGPWSDSEMTSQASPHAFQADSLKGGCASVRGHRHVTRSGQETLPGHWSQACHMPRDTTWSLPVWKQTVDVKKHHSVGSVKGCVQADLSRGTFG